MGQYTSYYLYQKYEQREGQDSIPCTPNIYSIDGNGTQQRVVKMENDPNCGYTPSSEPIYRWYQIPITEDYFCASCGTPPTPTGETIYRWVDDGYTCQGYDKWLQQKQQSSTDGGTTWTDTGVVSATTLVEANSSYCGYVPPTPPTGNMKFYAMYNDSTTYSAECDSSTALTMNDTKTYSTPYSSMTLSVVGDCILRISEGAFSGCTSLTSVTIPNSTIEIGQQSFSNCSGLTSITIPSGVTSIGFGAFSNCTSLTNIAVPSGVTSIYTNTFYNCNSLTSVTIPNSVTSIGQSAFDTCTSLTSIVIPSGVTSISSQAFGNCTGLTSIDIPIGVTSIGFAAFYNCTSLTNIVIPSGATSIGESSFKSCTSLTSITVNATTPPTLKNYAFDNTNNCPIYVPSASVNTYKVASIWKKYASRIQAVP